MNWISNIFWGLTWFALTVDGFRAVIAMLGWVPRSDGWLSRFVYGKYDRIVLFDALKDLGYNQRDGEVLVSRLQEVVPKKSLSSGVTNENVLMHVLSVLANCIQKYPRKVQYGGRTPSDSTYYINTMGATHNTDSLVVMVDAMVALINQQLENKKPDIIFVPKGGNPIFAKAVAESYGARLIVVKSNNDKSRVTLADPKSSDEQFLLLQSNYEGDWSSILQASEKQLSIVIDCNASGGSQLLDIACDLNKFIDSLATTQNSLNISKISDVFVLFRVDSKHRNVDQQYADLSLKIHRFFDLREKEKNMLYTLHNSHPDKEDPVNIYSPADSDKIKKIVQSLSNDHRVYWNAKLTDKS